MTRPNAKEYLRVTREIVEPVKVVDLTEFDRMDKRDHVIEFAFMVKRRDGNRALQLRVAAVDACRSRFPGTLREKARELARTEATHKLVEDYFATEQRKAVEPEPMPLEMLAARLMMTSCPWKHGPDALVAELRHWTAAERDAALEWVRHYQRGTDYVMPDHVAELLQASEFEDA